MWYHVLNMATINDAIFQRIEPHLDYSHTQHSIKWRNPSIFKV